MLLGLKPLPINVGVAGTVPRRNEGLTKRPRNCGIAGNAEVAYIRWCDFLWVSNAESHSLTKILDQHDVRLRRTLKARQQRALVGRDHQVG